MKKIALGLLFLCTNTLYCTPKIQSFTLNSLPKAGTFLGVTAMQSLTGLEGVNMRNSNWVYQPKLPLKNNQFPFFHVPYSKEAVIALKKHNIKKTIFIVRHPYDQAISLAHFLYVHPEFDAPQKYKPYLANKKMISQLITEIIHDTATLYEQYLPWINQPNVLTIYFEDLVGPKGKGTADRQLRALRKMASHIGLNPNDKKLKKVAKNLFGGTPTFRKGEIGEWKKVLTPQQKQLCREKLSHITARLGYQG